MSPFWRTRTPSPEHPFRDELLGIERLEERSLSLAATFTIDSNPRRRASNIFPRFKDNTRVLSEAYRILADDVRTGQFVTDAAEWLLDNFHLVTTEIRDIHQHLPGRYYRQLPALASREHAGHTRIYAMAVELVRHSDSRIDRQKLVVFINSYQRVAPLTIGELWAWPSMLKLALLENLRRLATETLASRRARLTADAYVAQIERKGGESAHTLPPAFGMASVVQLLHRVREYGLQLSSIRTAVEDHLAAQDTTAEAAIRGEHQRQAADQVSVANAIGSLRLCSTLDWRQYFESVSLVEQVLQRDPAGAYGRMDFLSRDRQRQAVEELAAPNGDAQLRVALRAVESARQAVAHGSSADRAAHVGYHLIDRGRPDLEVDVAYRPRLAGRIRRFVFARATLVYLVTDCDRDGAAGPAGRRLRLVPRRLPSRLGRAGAVADHPGGRHRDRPRPTRDRLGDSAPPPVSPRFLRTHSRRRAHDGRGADDAHERRLGRGPARACRGAGAR